MISPFLLFCVGMKTMICPSCIKENYDNNNNNIFQSKKAWSVGDDSNIV